MSSGPNTEPSAPHRYERIMAVRERLEDKLAKAPNDAHYMQVVVGFHDLAAVLDELRRLLEREAITG